MPNNKKTSEVLRSKFVNQASSTLEHVRLHELIKSEFERFDPVNFSGTLDDYVLVEVLNHIAELNEPAGEKDIRAALWDISTLDMPELVLARAYGYSRANDDNYPKEDGFVLIQKGSKTKLQMSSDPFTSHSAPYFTLDAISAYKYMNHLNSDPILIGLVDWIGHVDKVKVVDDSELSLLSDGHEIDVLFLTDKPL